MTTSVNDSTSISSISIDASEAAVGRFTENEKRTEIISDDDER